MQGGVGKDRRVPSPGRLHGSVRSMALTSDGITALASDSNKALGVSQAWLGPPPC